MKTGRRDQWELTIETTGGSELRNSPVDVGLLSLIITQQTQTWPWLLLLLLLVVVTALSARIIPKEGPRLSEKMLRVPAAEQGPAEI